jgi:NADH-quinone oxidoreductase subunit N
VFRSPGAALALAFCMICLAGLPPGLAGLFAKLVVFREIVDGGAGWLAVVMAVNTVIGLYYYVAWTGRLFTPASAEAVPAAVGGSSPAETAAVRGSYPAVWVGIGVALVATVLFSVAPQLVLTMTTTP